MVLGRLNSRGAVNLFSLEGSGAPVLYRGALCAEFDDSAFHWLDVTIRGERLRALLDFQPVVFEQNGRKMEWVEIQSTLSSRGRPESGLPFRASRLPDECLR